MKIGVSKCIFGIACRYDGKSKANQEIIDLLKDHEVILVCPEELGNLPTPRPSSEKQNGKWINIEGKDVTKEYLDGSNKAYELIKDCDFCILKSKSPACGIGQIYDGTFSRTLTNGNGSFAQKCIDNNIKVYTEKQIDKIKESLN